MNNTKKIMLVGFLLILLILVAGCSPAQPTEVPETEAPVETEPATLPPTELPAAATQVQEITEEPEETEVLDESDTNDAMSTEELSACVECHTDQAMLIDTADPVEEVESENEGSG